MGLIAGVLGHAPLWAQIMFFGCLGLIAQSAILIGVISRSRVRKLGLVLSGAAIFVFGFSIIVSLE